MPLLSTFGAASARGFGNLSGIALPSDDLFNTVSFLSHFDGTNNGTNNSFDDSSSSNHTITANGDVTQGSFGPFARSDGEWGVVFDGSGDRLRTNAASLDVTTEAFTAEAWIFPTTDMDQYDIIVCMFDLAHSSNSNQTWSIRASTSNTVEMLTVSGGTQTIQNAGTVNIGEWNHVAISRSGTTMYAALNGTVTSASCASSLNGHEYFYIGAADANGSASYFFNGSISNVRYEIGNARYTSSYTSPSSALTATANTKLLTCQSNRFVDNSTSAHTITVSGNAAVTAFGPFLTSSVYDAGVNGASAYFDGSDKLSSSASTDYEFGTGDLTVEYWAYPTASGAIQNILDNRAEASGWKLGRDASNQFQVYNEVTSSYLFESGNFRENAWSHFCWTRASGVNKFFINGVQSGSNVSDSSNFNSNSLNIGVQHGGDSQYFTGYITCCRVIKGTAVEPSGVPSAPPTAVTNTKLLLNMEDGQAIDSAAQNNMTLYGNAKISNAQSKFGDTSLYLDGTGDYATLTDTTVGHYGSGNFTAECFIYPTASPNQPLIIGQWSGSYSWALQLSNNSSRFLRFLTNAGGIVDNVSSTAVPLNQWSHVALVRNGNSFVAYLNGTSVVSSTVSGALPNSSDALSVGATASGGQPFQGYIDDVRISHTARYTANFTPSTEPFADKGQ